MGASCSLNNGDFINDLYHRVNAGDAKRLVMVMVLSVWFFINKFHILLHGYKAFVLKFQTLNIY